jgi:hypothetical protein
MIGLGFGAQLRFPFVCNPLPFFRVWCFLLRICVLVYTCTAFRNYMVVSYILTIQYIYLVSTYLVATKCLNLLPTYIVTIYKFLTY